MLNYISSFLLPVLCLILLLPAPSKAQYAYPNEKSSAFHSFDQLLITVYVDAYWSFDLDVIITDSSLLYVNVEDLFRNLKIACEASNGVNNLTGFIENENKPYSIDFNERQIKVGNKIINTKQGLMEEQGVIYLESSTLAEAFGLTITLNLRSLSAKLVADFELPLIKKMRIERSQKNISKLRGTPMVADTVITRNYHLFRFGMLDWAISSYQRNFDSANNFVSLGIGTELLFGQAIVSINYNDLYKFDNRQLQYSWRWNDNDNLLIKQAHFGVMYGQAVAFLNSPVIGAAISNSPNTVRKASGYYTINEYTEPNWTVELYINDVLTDYTTADASGLYVFKVPIVYGQTKLRLKFYGPSGEERTKELTMNMPFTFLPPKTLEYSISGGVLQVNSNHHYGLGTINYGVNRFLTLGGGMEYLSNLQINPTIPYVKAAIQPFSKMVLNIEYAHDVRMKGLLNFYFTQSAFLEIDYSKYEEGQDATRLNALEERKIRFTAPFKIKKVSLFTKLNFNQFVYKPFNYNQFDFVFSAFYKRYSANASFLINWIDDKPAYLNTNLSLSCRMRNGIILRPIAEYSFNRKNLIRYRVELEKRFRKSYFSFSYERNVQSKTDNFFLSLRYDLPFARAGFSAAYSNNNVNFAESAQGSLAFGGDNRYVKAGNNSSLAKGGVLFYPFLDLNQNSIQDNGEQRILLSQVKVPGGKAIISEKDSIVRISDLNAFTDYNVEFSDADLGNIAWRFKHNSYQVFIDPHQYKRVYVPVISVGEINGTVYLEAGPAVKGLGRITVQIFDKMGTNVAETLTESDGYFSYLGLAPGDYTIRIDENQLEKLHFNSTPASLIAEIKISAEGEVKQGLNFVLSSRSD